MNASLFREWIIEIAPRFPSFKELVSVIQGDQDWPIEGEEGALLSHLERVGHGNLKNVLIDAFDAFKFFCSPGAGLGKKASWAWHSEDLLDEITRSREYHLRHQNVSAFEFRVELGMRLWREMGVKTRIYIDTCHWIKMRDFELGRSVHPAYGEILNRLRKLVSSGRCICPLSPALFMELQTQQDVATRVHTATIMSELSLGVGLPHISEIERLELRRFTFDRYLGAGVINTDWELWRKGTMLIGEKPLGRDGMGSQHLWFVQKVMVDVAWNTPFLRIAAAINQGVDTSKMRDDFALRMKTEMKLYPPVDFETERNRSLASTIRHFIIPQLPSIHEEVMKIRSHRADLRRLERTDFDPRNLPSAQVLAGTEALIRSSGRYFRPNDMFDLFHCAVAIPYCQLFFCDKAFKAILTDKRLLFEQRYGTRVLALPDEILSNIAALGGS